MDQAEQALINSLLKRLERAEQQDLTALQKLELGYKEIKDKQNQKEAESFKKHTNKAVEDLTPLEKGAIRETERQLKQDKARDELTQAMEQLKLNKGKQRNWLNDPVTVVNSSDKHFYNGLKGYK